MVQGAVNYLAGTVAPSLRRNGRVKEEYEIAEGLQGLVGPLAAEQRFGTLFAEAALKV